MSDINYLGCVIGLSFLGILSSWLNARIVVCPKNQTQGRMLEVGFILVFLVSVAIVMFDVGFSALRLVMLIFLSLAVLSIIGRTIDHYFNHMIRHLHLCRIKAYQRNLGNLLNGKVSKDT